MNIKQTKIAVVTGANRGIGHEVCHQLAAKGYKVILTARKSIPGEKAAAAMRDKQLDVVFEHLDVADPASIDDFAARLAAQHEHVDALVNNAAIYYDSGNSVLEPDFQRAEEAMQINLWGTWRLTVALLPLIRKSPAGRIVNVSSEAGMLNGMAGGTPAYSITKAGVNVLTIKLAAALASSQVKVNAVCPGWVRTDMGGANATRSVEQGAKGIVWAATLPDDGPSGGFFRDGTPLDW